MAQIRGRLGPPAHVPRVLTAAQVLPSGGGKVGDFDTLFELVCAIQAHVGQVELEFTLVELEPQKPLPTRFSPLGDPNGQLLHTFYGDGEYVIVFSPAMFRVQAILLASVSRELGRLALHQAGWISRVPEDIEAHAELAAVALGLGVFVANGAYMFENACCGGGCGIDLTSLRAGLTLTESCFALALDARDKGLSRRLLTKHLDANQKAALNASWRAIERHPQLLALPSGSGARTIAGEIIDGSERGLATPDV